MFTAKVVRKKHVDLNKAARGLRGPLTIKVGFPSGSINSNVIEKAIYNHFGTSRGIPERPFLSAAMRDNKAKYLKGMKASAKKLLLGETSLRTALSTLGNDAQDDVKDSISTWLLPPNAQSTIDQKGSSQPLVDTGEMRNNVRWEYGE